MIECKKKCEITINSNPDSPRYNFDIHRGNPRYDLGYRYCALCEISIRTEGLFCPCCKVMLRRKSRHR